MRQGIGARQFAFLFGCRPARKVAFRLLLAAGALTSSVSAGVWMLNLRPEPGETATAAPVSAIASNPFGAVLVDLRTPLTVANVLAPSPLEPDLTPLSNELAWRTAEPEASAALTGSLGSDQAAPLPPRRPDELAGSANQARLAAAPRGSAQSAKKVAVSPDVSDNRTVIEKVFGALQPSEPQSGGSALAYAAPGNSVVDTGRKITSDDAFGLDRWTAVYDISAHTVYMPDGTRLEAHSGLGDKIDDPRYVHVKMHGATPPHVYDLTLRERLFHGVQALRLTPVGEGHIFGRAGLLAHTYMLGPRGDSNGCVSFKNYNAFLRAYLNGDVKRLVVVVRRD